MDWEATGTRLQTARERSGKTRRELSELSGIPEDTLHQVEQGALVKLDLTAMDLLAQALDIRLDHLLYGPDVNLAVPQATSLDGEQPGGAAPKKRDSAAALAALLRRAR